ncbi:SDR family oxidoreductase [Mitsuaria sp. WAJ17]|uniref:SDR family oxidoreductase n=1 Tax=Mitsuaria sp. WAJ17 TaxID=2761452 RepID=UPI001602AD77|nr:SDR family oxidoreductase [Mitsuaria sp. WAJ17]MBB2487659.1 SDR family oxidoreductase [Mitsuaria sp. WAJ17]
MSHAARDLDPPTVSSPSGRLPLPQEQPQRRDAQLAPRIRGQGPVQAGPTDQPGERPPQHLYGSGSESQLHPPARYMAEHYRGSGKLQGQVALITGGDSGIGRAVAVLFAREGADVCLVHLSAPDDARDTAGLVEAEGRRALVVAGDVLDPDFCESAVRVCVAELGRLDVLVNNAAYQKHADSLLDIDQERLEHTYRTNVFGYLQMARAALPHLKRGASIINTGSCVGLRGHQKLIGDSASKGAVHAFTKALAQGLLSEGIRVNAVAPGPVWTPLNPAEPPPEQVPELDKRSDRKRPAQPEELSPAYVFLASPACSSYITGVVLPVTGSVGAL